MTNTNIGVTIQQSPKGPNHFGCTSRTNAIKLLAGVNVTPKLQLADRNWLVGAS